VTKIYYFSGTGNTFWSAQKIAEKISAGSDGADVQLVNMGMEAQKKEIILEADALVFLFPAYAYGAPVLVRRFIKRAVLKTSHISVFTTFGSSPGGALAEVARILKRKNAAPVYYGRIPSVENYIVIFGTQKPDVIKKRLEMQRIATDEAAAAVAQKLTNRIWTFRPISAFIAALFSLGIKLFYKWYKVNEDCDGCRICERLCPVNAITMRDNKPVFSRKCEHCQGCINWCPKRAINYLNIHSDTPRYNHPEVTAGKMFRR